MPTFYIGASSDHAPRPRYLERLRFVEYDFRTAVPSARTLSRWQRDAGEDFSASLVAPPALWGERDWPLRDARATAREMDRLGESAKALSARAVVLRSPSSIRPGTTALKKLVELFARARTFAPVCVWEPQGVWSYDEAVAVARDHGVLVACDPLHDAIGDARVVYARMRGMGHDRRYHAGRLEDLAEAVRSCDEVFVAFATETAFAEACKLRSVIENLPALEEDLDDDEEGDDLDEDEEGDFVDDGEDDEDDEDDDEDAP